MNSNGKPCTVCGAPLADSRRCLVTVRTPGDSVRTHDYCESCAARYLDTVDMFGMTLPLIDSVRTLPAA